MKKRITTLKTAAMLLSLILPATAVLANETSAAGNAPQQSGLQTFVAFTILLLFILAPLFKKRKSNSGN